MISTCVLVAAAAGGRWIGPLVRERFFQSVHPLYEPDDAAAALLVSAVVCGAIGGLAAWILLR